MLGRAADAFFSRQKSERILAAAPNGEGRSLTLPDRGDSGSTAVMRVRGSYEMPGPQNSFVQHAQPGGALPGMGCALPGMGFMPGLGEEEYVDAGPEADDDELEPETAPNNNTTMLVLAGVAVALFLANR